MSNDILKGHGEKKHQAKLSEELEGIARKLSQSILTPATETSTSRLIHSLNEKSFLFDQLEKANPLSQLLSEKIDLPKTLQALVSNVHITPLHNNAINKQTVSAPQSERIEKPQKELYTYSPDKDEKFSAYFVDTHKKITRNSTQILSAADIGTLVKQARKKMKLSQTEFAAHAGVGRRFVSELENGKGSLEFEKVITCALTAGIDISAKLRASL